MQRLKLPAVALLAVALASAPAFAGGNANFIFGTRSLSDDLWDPLDDQGVFGANVDFGKNGWPVNLEGGLYVSYDDDEIFGVDVEATITELSFGVNKTWSPHRNIHPYVGGGLTRVDAEIQVDLGGISASEDDSSIGLYGHGGVYWRIGSRFNIGGDIRIVRGTDINLAGLEGDADYEQFAILLGWGWPARK